MTTDSNGTTVTKDIRKEPDGTWGRTVWFGSHNVTTVRRYFYSSRQTARAGDISDEIGTAGRVSGP